VRGHNFRATNHRPKIRRGQNPPTGQNETFRVIGTERRRLKFRRIREVQLKFVPIEERTIVVDIRGGALDEERARESSEIGAVSSERFVRRVRRPERAGVVFFGLFSDHA